MALAVLFVLLACLAAAPAASAAPAEPTASAAACRPFGASFAPTRGDPARLRVRFTVARFGRGRPIYLHYVAPDGDLRRTVRLGRTAGRCGYLRTGYRRLFPFRARPGTWRLRFDTRRAYRSRPSRPYVTLAVNIVRR